MMLPQTSKSPKSPAVPSDAYASQVGSWVKIQTVLDGTEAMRQAEKAYLPQHTEESDTAYSERLSRATLFNMTELTLDSWTGRPFSDRVAEDEADKPPTQVSELFKDIDMMGNELDVFARRLFRDGLAKAFTHILVDYPKPRDTQAEEGRARTLADDRKENLRPYWVHIRPEHLFFADAEVVEGRELLREIRLFEVARERQEFAEVCIPQIRRLVRVVTDDGKGVKVQVEIYREVKKAKKEEDKWRLFDSWLMDIDVIPLVTFYADREGFMLGKSPIEDLVDLNIAHWQSTSDQRVAVTVARFPILALSGGVDENKDLTIGPHEWLYSPDPQSEFYYVEHTGAALEAGRKDLEDLERQMGEYGAEFLKKKPGNPTATARALDSAESTSPLQDVAYRFMDALSQALDLTARWLKQEDGGRVTVVTDFGPEEFNAQDFTALTGARKQRDLSLETFLTELKRRGVLDDDVDVAEEIERLENEALNMTGAAATDLLGTEQTEQQMRHAEDTHKREMETPPKGPPK
jgi:hypothetical protein